MQIVIDIPEELYDKLMTEQSLPKGYDPEYPIIHGTPLPKGHGRLIEADRLKEVFMRNTRYDYHDLVDIAPTIIEADKEGEE